MFFGCLPVFMHTLLGLMFYWGGQYTLLNCRILYLYFQRRLQNTPVWTVLDESDAFPADNRLTSFKLRAAYRGARQL